MINEIYKQIVNGKGGLDGNSIPVYSDHNAPYGGKILNVVGNQLMLPNGFRLVVVDPLTITSDENDHEKFMTFKDNGEVNYIRAWILDEDTGHGVDYNGQTMWVEYSHLAPYDFQVDPARLRKVLVEEISPGEWIATEIEDEY